MSKTLQEILEQDAGGKFPFRAMLVRCPDPWFEICGKSSEGAFVGLTYKDQAITFSYAHLAEWTFIPTEKPKVLRSEWLWENPDDDYIYRTAFVTDAEAKEQGYLRKIPGTEMEFDQ